MKRTALAALAAATLLSACSTTSSRSEDGAATASDRTPPARSAADPFPSTYRAYPGVVTAITGATIYDGEGGRIENGTVVLADGRVQAIGGADTAIPEGAT